VSTCGNISGAYLILFTSWEISRGHLYVQIQDQSSGMRGDFFCFSVKVGAM
jgi:IS4 transposase